MFGRGWVAAFALWLAGCAAYAQSEQPPEEFFAKTPQDDVDWDEIESKKLREVSSEYEYFEFDQGCWMTSLS